MKLAALMLAVASWCRAQTWEFEDATFRGWTQTGRAFAGQPFCKAPDDRDMPSSRFTDSRLGGDYWQDLRYPLGQQGNCLVTSLLKLPDPEPWSLTSPEFTLDAAKPYLSFLIGGSRKIEHELIELQVRRTGDFVATFSATGEGLEQLRQVVYEVPESDRGLRARIRISDDWAAGHINVDYIRFTEKRPDEPRLPVWGYADYHTHPMTHLAFGTNDKRQVIFGSTGSKLEEYNGYGGHKWIKDDIGHCTRGHGGGYLAESFLNNAQLLDQSGLSVIKAFLLPHKRSGGPEFADFPSHLMGAHQQMHVTQIRRNYEGGLRLMVALVTDNWGPEFLTGVAENGSVPLTCEKDTIRKQMQGFTDLVKLNSSWMEIATSSEHARRIIQQNRLAIVPGVEVDQLGKLDPKLDMEHEVEFLWKLGVRVVTPIHAVDNDIGGPAIHYAAYNWLNDFIVGGAKQVRPSKLGPAYFFQVEKDNCTTPHGECVIDRLDPNLQLRIVISRPILTLFRRAPGFVIRHDDDFKGALGQKNQKGLTPKSGEEYLRALMKYHMIVDTAHMSDYSVRDTHAILDPLSYPAIVSHAHFRAEGLYDEHATAEYKASEYDISDSNLTNVGRTGGVVGPFVAQPRINEESVDHHVLHIRNDCGNSSKGFAFSFHYGQEKASGSIGMATDFTLIPGVSPRFGEHACEGYKAVKHAKRPANDQPALQRHPVVYRGFVPPFGKGINQREPMDPSRMDDRVFDFNYDGLAHFGLVPDMLQDVKNVGLPTDDFQALFQSAEVYLRMWERVERTK